MNFIAFLIEFPGKLSDKYFCRVNTTTYLISHCSGCAPGFRSTPSRSLPPPLVGPAFRTCFGRGQTSWCQPLCLRSAVSRWSGSHLRPIPRWLSAWHSATDSWLRWPKCWVFLWVAAKTKKRRRKMINKTLIKSGAKRWKTMIQLNKMATKNRGIKLKSVEHILLP